MLRLEPIDAAGVLVPDASVRTLYGADRGGTLVPANDQTFEQLGFFGAGAAHVGHARVSVTSVRWLRNDPAVMDARFSYELRGARGVAITAAGDARTVRIVSEADVEIVVSLAYQVLEAADEGPQNALALVLVADGVRVAPRDTVTAELTAGGVAALRRWTGTDRYQELIPFLPAGQPALAEADAS